MGKTHVFGHLNSKVSSGGGGTSIFFLTNFVFKRYGGGGAKYIPLHCIILFL